MAIKHRKTVVVALIATSFAGLAAMVVWTARSGGLTPEQALLVLVALFGLYVGFGILVAVYRLISKLD